MYRCKDCQKEYKEKVEYCDCGNNSFEYIEDVVLQKKVVREPFTSKEKSAIISQIFFLVCLILSAVVWFIPVKTEPQAEKQPVKNETVTKTFPSIDRIWNSTPPKQSMQLSTILPVVPEPVAVSTSTPIQRSQNSAQTKPVQTTQSKPITTQKPAQTQPKPVQTQTKPAASQTNPTQTQSVQTQTKPAASQTNPIQTQPVQTQTKPAQAQSAQAPKVDTPAETKPVYNPNSQTMLKYKGELRSALFKKLPVGSIQGSGSCVVQFSVDSTGKLVNRSFAQQSDNKSLNDAVYYMMMSVPKFNPPPSEYNGSLIKMNFKFDNGSYEISIY